MRIRKIITIIALAFATVANAAQPGNGTITIKPSKVTNKLVQSWANAYKAIHPEINIVLDTKATDADLVIVNDDNSRSNITIVGRYALLPVTSSSNPLLSDIYKKSWNAKDIKKLYFSSLDDDFADEDDDETSGKAGKLREKLTVYSGTNANSASHAFAKYFGYKTAELRGNKIAGDDLYLLNAIEEDKQSITFSDLAYLYDSSSRSLKKGISILPLNLKKDINEKIQKGNLDEVLSVIENQTFDVIPVASLGITYSNINTDALEFLEWIVKDGQKLNNSNGFLKLTQKDAETQEKLLAYRDK